jgi:CheY-like chemotaxis protein
VRRILLVEDSKMHQLVALRMLEMIGYSADVIGDGNSAIALLGGRRYDLILMDCEMPGLDGYETTALIRDLERAAQRPGMPIVGLGAPAGRNIRAAVEAGMDDELTKPLRIEDLQRAIERWLGAVDIRDKVTATTFAVRDGSAALDAG